MPRVKGNDSRLHSFTLFEDSSSIIGMVKDQQKSAFVRKAIVHYDEWIHTEHKQLKLDDYVGVADIKTANMKYAELEKRIETWVIMYEDLQKVIFQLQKRKWWQFWK